MHGFIVYWFIPLPAAVIDTVTIDACTIVTMYKQNSYSTYSEMFSVYCCKYCSNVG